MPPALTPALALDYVHELSADVRAGIVLDAAGERLAGPPALAGPARELLSAGGDAAELEAATVDGVVCAVSSASHAAVAVCGRFAIAGVVRQDLRTALAALEGRAPADPPATPSGRARDAPAAPPAALSGPTHDAQDEPAAPSGRAHDALGASPGAAHDASEPALMTAANRLISAVQRHSGA
jgi:hypothetical protein